MTSTGGEGLTQALTLVVGPVLFASPRAVARLRARHVAAVPARVRLRVRRARALRHRRTTSTAPASPATTRGSRGRERHRRRRAHDRRVHARGDAESTAPRSRPRPRRDREPHRRRPRPARAPGSRRWCCSPPASVSGVDGVAGRRARPSSSSPQLPRLRRGCSAGPPASHPALIMAVVLGGLHRAARSALRHRPAARADRRRRSTSACVVLTVAVAAPRPALLGDPATSASRWPPPASSRAGSLGRSLQCPCSAHSCSRPSTSSSGGRTSVPAHAAGDQQDRRSWRSSRRSICIVLFFVGSPQEGAASDRCPERRRADLRVRRQRHHQGRRGPRRRPQCTPFLGTLFLCILFLNFWESSPVVQFPPTSRIGDPGLPRPDDLRRSSSVTGFKHQGIKYLTGHLVPAGRAEGRCTSW